MVLHLLYIIAFTILAILAVANMIRNLMNLGIESQRSYSPNGARGFAAQSGSQQSVPHPELLDSAGRLINEPLLVMRSMTVDDAREQLDALYESSPGPSGSSDTREDV